MLARALLLTAWLAAHEPITNRRARLRATRSVA
jgi:hypothetical protein